jgi:hypothetical protein
MDQEQQSKKMSQIVAKCWADDSFKQQLLAEPMATLKAEGVELPEGLAVNVLQNTTNTFNLVIPVKPTELSGIDLDHVAGGNPTLITNPYRFKLPA